MNTAIQTINLCKEYNKIKVVDNLNLNISEGTLYALLGLNGAGKTTTIKMLTDLVKPTFGEIKILDKSPNKVKEYISISPQESAVCSNLTVKENIQFMKNIYNSDCSIDEILIKLKLKDVENKIAKKLSGGYLRRLSIAMALVTKPKVLFLDEPTLGLDVLARLDLWDIIAGLKGKITIVLTTHYLEEVEFLCDQVGILNNGRLVIEGSIESIIERTNCKNFEDAFVKIVRNS